MRTINCSIITIGDELLIGQTIDTNSAWIGQQLNAMGIWVKRRVAVGDVKQDIIDALDQETLQSDLIIITGGLGPTADDITKPLLCEYFNTTLVENPEVLEHVIHLFSIRNRPMLDVNLRQALVPLSCQVLFNKVGTAPGMWFEKEHKIYISLPGVPFEMEHIIRVQALPRLKNYFSTPTIQHKTLVTMGEGESFLANRLITFEEELPAYIKLAYLPKLGGVKLRLTASNISTEELELYFGKLKSILENITVADSDIELEQVIHNILIEKNETLSIAESCTGGALSAAVTSIKGASSIFKGGLVTYSNSSKLDILGVQKNTLDTFTAISEETAIEMAIHCRNKMKSTYSLSVTGNLEKQDGETFVWVAMAKEQHVVSKKINVFYDRAKNAVFITNTALNLLRLFMLQD